MNKIIERKEFTILLTLVVGLLAGSAYLVFRLGRKSAELEKWSDYDYCGY